RFQQLLSQLEAHGAEVSTKDANHKFLRSLPPAWSNLAMTMRTKLDVDTFSIDDFKSSTNKVKSGHTGAYSTCTPTSSNIFQEREVPAGFADEVIYSLFPKQSGDLDLLHEDLEQIDDIDIEEMDINWLNIVNDNIGSAFMSTSKLNDLILWHASLGNVHVKRMQDMYKDSDLCDFHAAPSLGNKKYFVMFIDNASRIPNKRNMITLYELWTTKKPNLNYLRVWDCRAVVRIPDPKLKTLGERGIECIFVGYVEHSKAFSIYVIESNESSDVMLSLMRKDSHQSLYQVRGP
ncbi:hypothetical protein Tco_1507131, partial [Tanacetum coccineum]